MKTYVIRRLTEWQMLAIDEGLKRLAESGKAPESDINHLRANIEDQYQGQRHDKIKR